MSRYSRHIVLEEIGPLGQQKLARAKVLVIGAGGLGCPALQYLAAAGIGTIGIVDFDVVEESNLQRQILFGASSLGTNKAIAAKTRLEDLNPLINIVAFAEKLTPHNALDLFATFDLIIDGTDNFATRYLINDAAILTDKPVVFGAIYKFEGQLTVFNYKGGPSYRCLFATPPKAGSVANCSEVGVLGVLPGIIGSMQANEAIKIILELDQVLSGKMLCYDAKTTESHHLKIVKSESEIETVLARKHKFTAFDYEAFCGLTIPEISAAAAVQLKNVLFVDVRELTEKPEVTLPNCVQIPLGDLNNHLSKFKADQHSVLFCQTGVRSKLAVQQLIEHKIEKCFSLIGGAESLLNYTTITK
ncbi:MAG: HesA/MoeB/ThiF family protein [Gilvibacter sp.]